MYSSCPQSKQSIRILYKTGISVAIILIIFIFSIITNIAHHFGLSSQTKIQLPKQHDNGAILNQNFHDLQKVLLRKTLGIKDDEADILGGEAEKQRETTHHENTSQMYDLQTSMAFNQAQLLQQGYPKDVHCEDYHVMNVTDMCFFANNVSDCSSDDGLIQYFQWISCSVSPTLFPAGLLLLFLWWLFLFIGLAVTAEDFFCSSLSVISKTLKLSDNIAGVTFMAFGNGAPDIFAALSAITSNKKGSTNLAFGALFGAGMFVTTIVVGAIAIIQPFYVSRRPFLRDLIMYIVATYYAFYVLWDGDLSLYESIGFIVLYVFYVLIVIFGWLIRNRWRKIMTSLNTPADKPDKDIQEMVLSNSYVQMSDSWCSNKKKYQRTLSKIEAEKHQLRETTSIQYNDDYNEDGYFKEITDYVFPPSNPVASLLYSINPVSCNTFKEGRWHTILYEIFKAPIVFCLIITIPRVEYSIPNHNWNRMLNSLHLITSSLFVTFAFDLGTKNVNGVFPVYGIVLLGGTALAILVFVTSSYNHPPRYHVVFAFIGFAVSIAWIYSIANEVVNILQLFGMVGNISHAALGLTLLAWGNGLADLVSDTIMARKGLPKVGVSAAFGEPIFNLLLGIGIPFTICILNNHDADVLLSVPFISIVLAAFLLGSLVQSLVIVFLSRFYMSRVYGIYLWIYYVIFLIVALLTAFDVINVKDIH